MRACCLLAAGLALAACAPEDDQEAGGREKAQPVKTVQVESKSFVRTVEAVGALEAPARAPVSPELSAQVKEVHFREGQQVDKGQALFTLDDAKVQRAIARAEAALQAARQRADNARSTFRRYRQLLRSGAVSQHEFDQRSTAYRTAASEVRRLEAELGLERERLADTRIAAPVAGRISARRADPGDLVGPEDVLAEIYSLDPLEAAFSVPQRHQGQVRRGQEVRLETPAWPGERFAGRVTYVAPSLEPATRQLPVKAEVPNPRGRLKPGAFATVSLRLGRGEPRPWVPEQALVATRSGYVVFVVQDGRARRRAVEPGRRRPGVVEIGSGLSAGEEVVTAGMQTLRDGAPIKVTGRGRVAGRGRDGGPDRDGSGDGN
jgi:membrane fusion protein (multidrug efflux system)